MNRFVIIMFTLTDIDCIEINANNFRGWKQYLKNCRAAGYPMHIFKEL
jgi:hypothetical protein